MKIIYISRLLLDFCILDYLVENDNGVENYYSSGFFRDLRKDELREEKLKELGI